MHCHRLFSFFRVAAKMVVMASDQISDLLDQLGVPQNNRELAVSASLFAAEIGREFRIDRFIGSIRIAAIAIASRMLCDRASPAIANQRAPRAAARSVRHDVSADNLEEQLHRAQKLNRLA